MEDTNKGISPILLVLLGAPIVIGITFGAFMLFGSDSDEAEDTNEVETGQESDSTMPDSFTNELGTEEMDSNENVTDEDATSTDQEQTVGTYEEFEPSKLALANERNVVLFFKADWCPSCNALDRDIEANLDQIPGDLTILKVDYDSRSGATDAELQLRDDLNVTYQHTIIQVDADGNRIQDVISGFRLSQIIEDLGL